jgi:hypothetical protein
MDSLIKDSGRGEKTLQRLRVETLRLVGCPLTCWVLQRNTVSIDGASFHNGSYKRSFSEHIIR